MNLETIIICLTILIAPSIACPLLLFDGYILPQIGAIAIGVGITLTVFMFHGFLVYNTFIVLCLVYFFYLMLTNIWSTCINNSEKDVPLVFGYLIGAILLFNLFTLFDNSLLIITITISTITIILSVYAILQSYGIDPLFPDRVKSRKEELKNTPINQLAEFYRNDNCVDVRAISTLGNTNFAAGFFICGLPFIFILCSLTSWWFGFLSIPVIIAINKTNSRAGTLSLIGFILFFLLLCKQRNWIWETITSASEIELFIVQLVVGILFCLAWIKYIHKFRKAINFLSKDNNLNNFLDVEKPDESEDVEAIRDHPVAHLRYRFRYWRSAFWIIKQRPILGYGLRTYRREVYKAQAELNALTKGQFLDEKRYATPQPRECHNDIIENFVEGGVIGGLLFLIIIGLAFSHGLSYIEMVDGSKAILMMFILSGIVGVLIDASFFFPLRLGPSAFCFWTLVASIEYLYTKEVGFVKIFSFTPNLFMILMLATGIGAFLYKTVLRPNISNYYFTRHCFTPSPAKREKLLRKALSFDPENNIVLSNMVIGYVANFPKIAERFAIQMYENFDGMIPAWAMSYNYGLVRFFNKDYEIASELFQESLYYLPYFEPSRHLLSRVWPLAAFPNRGVAMKIISPDVAAFITQCKEQGEKGGLTQEEARILELNVLCSILNEKVRLNIPFNWAFNLDEFYFMSPGEINENFNVIEAGHIKLLLAKRRK